MKNALGITRNIDALGRVVLPKEIRIALGYEVGTPLEMISDKGGVYIRKQSGAAHSARVWMRLWRGMGRWCARCALVKLW